MNIKCDVRNESLAHELPYYQHRNIADFNMTRPYESGPVLIHKKAACIQASGKRALFRGMNG